MIPIEDSSEHIGGVHAEQIPTPVRNSKMVKQSKEEDEHIVPYNNIPVVLIGLIMTMFLAALDQTIIATTLPTIAAELGGGNAYSWVGSSYLIAGAAMSPAYGKLSDILGRKLVLYPCIMIFLVGSALCGAAKSMPWLILTRALQGIGAGGIMQLVQVVIGDIIPLDERGTYGTFVGAAWGIAAVTGPVIGGALAEHVSWRWCFWINLPTGGVAGALLFFSLNLNPHQGKTFKEHIREFDFGGLFLFIGGVVSLLLGLTQSQNGWDRPAAIAPLVVGFVIIILGVGFESWTTRSPVLPPRLFRTRTTGLIFYTAFFHAFANFSAAFYLPLYFQIMGASATKSGLLILPFSFASSVASALGGIAVSRLGDYRLVMWLGYTVMTVGYGLLIMLNERSSFTLQSLLPMVSGIGLGFLFTPPLIGMQAAMSVQDMAVSSTTYGLFRMLGSSVGVSVGQAIWTGVLRAQLSDIPGLNLDLSGAALADSIRQVQSIQPESLRQQVRRAYTKGVSAIWIVNTPIIVTCLIAALFLKKYSLKRKVIRKGKKGVREVVSENEQPSSEELEMGSTDPNTLHVHPKPVDREAGGKPTATATAAETLTI